MGNAMPKTTGHPSRSLSSSSLSNLMWTLQISDDVVRDKGQVKADGMMAVKIGSKRISVPRPSTVFWVGVLLEKNGWIHTGIGLRNDITVTFENGVSRSYRYLVAHGTAGDDKKFKVHLSFSDNLDGIYTSLADAFNTKVDLSFTPVLAGNTWQTHKYAADIITKMEYFLGRTFNMKSPEPGETNCVHFSIAMYLHFAAEDESKMRELLGKVSGDIRNQDFRSMLKKLGTELDKISF